MKRAAVLAALALLACSSSSNGTPPTTSAAPARSRVEISPLEGRPSAVAVSAGTVWVADDERGVVLRLDQRTGKQLGPAVAVSPHPIAIDVSEHRVWVADRAGTITRIDSVSATVTDAPIELGGHVVDLVVDGAVVWVADIERDAVQTLDETSGALGQRIPVAAGVVRLAAGPTGPWVTNRDHTATKIDRVTRLPGRPVEVGAGPIGVTVADNVVWIANADDGTVSRLSADDGHAIGAVIAVGGAPISVVVVNNEALVIQQDGRAVSRIDVPTGAVVERAVDLHLRPRDAASSSAGTWVVGIDPSAAVLVMTPGA